MASRERSDDDHHPSDNISKRAERIETGESGKHPIHSSRQATADAGESVVKQPHAKAEVDDVSASRSLGIAESAARDRGESVPTTPYSRGQA